MPEPTTRLDKFLWCARLVKTRDSARQMIERGVVRLNRVKTVKPAHDVRPGDVLTFFWAGRLHIWRVSSLPQRRGPAAKARLLYDELNEDR
jgi:ribosome-associated heat shock protein Hsp15